MAVKIDPNILNKQSDWEDILTSPVILADDSYGYSDPTFDSMVYLARICDMSMAVKGRLAEIWFKRAIDGVNIYYPQSKKELTLYEISRSKIYTVVVDICLLMIFLSPMLEEDKCQSVFSKKESNNQIGSLVLIATLVQHLDNFVFFRTNHWNNKWQISNSIKFDHIRIWFFIRVVCCFLLTLNSMLYLVSHNISNVSRALLPILFFTRKDNFRQIAEGIFFSFKKSLKILRLLFYMLLIWAFVGFCLFRRYGSGHNSVHFSTYWWSLYTCLHCLLSRPTVLYRLKPIFDELSYAALYFVVLTFIGDIVLTSLIVAIGTRNFRDYSIENFKGRLRYRHNALQAIYALYCNDQYLISLENWLLFGKHLGIAFRIENNQYAKYLFDTEDKEGKGFIDRRQFFRLCAAVSSNLVFMPNSEVVRNSKRYSTTPAYEFSFGTESRRGSRRPSGKRSDDSKDGGVEISQISGKDLMDGYRDRAVSTQTEDSYRASADTIHDRFGTRKHVDVSEADTQEQMRATPFRQRTRGKVLHFMRSKFKEYGVFNALSALRRVCFYIEMFEFVVALPRIKCCCSWLLRRKKPTVDDDSVTEEVQTGDSYTWRINLLELSNLCACFLAIWQLCYLANRDVQRGWLALGWMLWFYFVFENVVHYYAAIQNNLEVLFHALVNLLNFIALCWLGTDSSDLLLAPLTFVVLIQSIRLLCLYRYLPRIDVFIALLPIVLRSMFFYLLVLYAFSVIGHDSFCSLLDPMYVQNTDDDSASWVEYSNLLNFNTFLKSYYTMAQLAVLSNWSIVMDAAVVCSQKRKGYTFLFFYLYRVSMALVILPLLMSCIIQTFVQKLMRRRDDQVDGRKKIGLKFYNISGSEMFATGMVALWSASGRETVPVVVSKEDGVIDKLRESVRLGQVQIREITRQNILLLKQLPRTTTFRSIMDTLQMDRYIHFHVAESAIIQEQKEWLKLLTETKLVHDPTDHISMNMDSHVASVRHAVGKNHHGLIERQLFALEVARSRTIHTGMYFVVLFQMCSVLLIQPKCLKQSDLFYGTRTISRQALAVINLLCVIFYLFEISIDFIARGKQIRKNKFRHYFTSWTWWRLIICLFIVVDSLVVLADKTSSFVNLRLIRGVYPLLIICRDLNYKEMVKGLLVAVRGSSSVYALLASLLIVFTLLGFFLFHRYPTHANYFMNLGTSFAAVLHCYTSAPYSLHVVEPYFQASQASPAFFVILTYCTEVLCISLLLATGTVHYRAFCDRNLLRRLKKRYNGIRAIWKLFEDSKSQTMALRDWMFLCSGMKYKYAIDPVNAKDLFMYVCKTTKTRHASDVNEFNGGQSVYSKGGESSVLIRNSTNFQRSMTPSEYADLEENQNYDRITKPQFFRLMSLLYMGARCRVVNSPDELRLITEKISKHQSLADVRTGSDYTTTTRSLRAASKYFQEELESSVELSEYELSSPVGIRNRALSIKESQSVSLRKRKASIMKSFQSHGFINCVAEGTWTIEERDTTLDRGTEASTVSTANHILVTRADAGGSKAVAGEEEPTTTAEDNEEEEGVEAGKNTAGNEAVNAAAEDKDSPTLVKKWDFRLSTADEAERMSRFSSDVGGDVDELQQLYRKRHMINVLHIKEKDNSFLHGDHFRRVQPFLQMVVKGSKIIVATELLEMITIFEITLILAHFLLIIQLSYYSSERLTSAGWAKFGYFLESYFLAEMVIRMIALGEKKFFRNTIYIYQFLLNVGSFAAMIAVGNNFTHTNAAFLFVVLFQSMRLVLMLWLERGDDKLKPIIVMTARAMFLLIAVIYFFSIIAQDVFCGVLTSSSGTNNNTNDDDASSWTQFSNILNFNNYLQTMFTLFEVMVLGSWSMVMDATAQNTNPISAYFFFYTFRLLMTLVMLPLLMSFIIRSFITLNDTMVSKARKKKDQQEQRAKDREAAAVAAATEEERIRKNTLATAEPPSTAVAPAAAAESPADTPAKSTARNGSVDSSGTENGTDEELDMDNQLDTATEGDDDDEEVDGQTGGASNYASATSKPFYIRWLKAVISFLRSRSYSYRVIQRVQSYIGQKELISQIQLRVDKHDNDVGFVNLWTTATNIATDIRKQQEIKSLTKDLENVKNQLDYHCDMHLFFQECSSSHVAALNSVQKQNADVLQLAVKKEKKKGDAAATVVVAEVKENVAAEPDEERPQVTAEHASQEQ